jgi:hypothetical protein
MENVGISYGHVVFIMAIWCNVCPFGVVLAVLWYILPVLVCLDQEKSGNPAGIANLEVLKS